MKNTGFPTRFMRIASKSVFVFPQARADVTDLLYGYLFKKSTKLQHPAPNPAKKARQRPIGLPLPGES